jgi:hypothetical protein
MWQTALDPGHPSLFGTIGQNPARAIVPELAAAVRGTRSHPCAGHGAGVV